jgi:glutathione S-transferase
MRVYHREHAGRPVRIVWTLEEIGAPYELVILTREEGAGDAHRARHPLGRVPVLEDDEGPLFESAAICLHLADLHPDAGLAPAAGSHERALVYQWAVYAPAELEPPLFAAWVQAERDPERATGARERFLKAAGAVSDALGDGDYLVAETFTVADILVGTALAFTAVAGFGEQLPDNLRAYVGRLAERDAFRRATAKMQS